MRREARGGRQQEEIGVPMVRHCSPQVLNFGSWDYDMIKVFRTAIPWLRSDNRKSKSENLKWVGFLAIVVALTVCGARAEAQQPKKVPRIGYLASADPARESVRSEAIRLAAMWMSSH